MSDDLANQDCKLNYLRLKLMSMEDIILSEWSANERTREFVWKKGPKSVKKKKTKRLFFVNLNLQKKN